MDEIPQHMLPKKASPRDYAITSHYVRVTSGVTPEMALDPNFWQHLAQKFRVEDEVTVRAEDGSFRLMAEVVAIDPLQHWVQLRQLLLVADSSRVLGAPDRGGYSIQNDPVQGWRILRGHDLVLHGLPDEAAARAKVAELQVHGEPAVMKRKVA